MDIKLKNNRYLRQFKQGWGNSLGCAWGVKPEDLPTEVNDKVRIGGNSMGVKDGDLIITDYFDHRYLFEIEEVEYKRNPRDLWFAKAVLIEIDYFSNNEVSNISKGIKNDSLIICHY